MPQEKMVREGGREGGKLLSFKCFFYNVCVCVFPGLFVCHTYISGNELHFLSSVFSSSCSENIFLFISTMISVTIALLFYLKHTITFNQQLQNAIH